jgi:hypothetical protein
MEKRGGVPTCDGRNRCFQVSRSQLIQSIRLSAVLTWTGFVNGQRAAVQLPAIEPGDGLEPVISGAHLHKSKSLGLSGYPVDNQVASCNLASPRNISNTSISVVLNGRLPTYNFMDMIEIPFPGWLNRRQGACSLFHV